MFDLEPAKVDREHIGSVREKLSVDRTLYTVFVFVKRL